jgi:CRP-like cAMP-binding protein
MSMEAVHDPDQSSTSWVARLVEVLQPLSLRADRLAGMEALVSANARPLRVVGYGDAVGIAPLLNGGGSPETTIALSAIRALTVGQDQFRELASRPSIRARLVGALPHRRRSSRP